MLYLAYGSNLHVAQMAVRCPDARPVGSATLYGWRLAFRCRGLSFPNRNGYLTIEKTGDLRDFVPVGVWEISRADERSLDFYEGAPTFYRKAQLAVDFRDLETGEQRSGSALVYIMREPYSPALPHPGYVNACARGCIDFCLDRAPLEAAVVAVKKEVK